MKSIIFDLDLTLVDSTVAEEARKQRNWGRVYSLIPQFTLYPGMESVFEAIRTKGLKVAIVSTAPSTYVKKVVDHFNIPVNAIVGYHDANIKPSPEGMFLAMQKLGSNPSETISFGDRTIDITASKAASIYSVACLWGSKEVNSISLANPDQMIHNPCEILDLI